MTILAKGISGALAMALFVAVAQAQTTVTEQADGAVAVSLEGRQVSVVPAEANEDVIASIGEHADDPQELQQAIRAIVAEYAAGPGDAALATAIGALAIYYLGPGVRSASTDAIMRGAALANPNVAAPALLAALPALRANPRTKQAGERQLAQLQATAENPAQISPVQ